MKAREILEAFPQLIVKLENNVAAARALVDVAKGELEIAEAEAAKLYADSKNQTLMQAHITLDPNVRQKKKERIEAQENYLGRVALYNHANNAVDSAKKYYNAGTPDSEIEVLPELFSPSLT